ERDEAIARNECLGDYLDQVRRQNAGGRLNESSSPNQRGSTLIDKSANSSMHVESLELAKEKELLQQQFARDSEQIRANAQDTLDNVLLSNDETNARYQEEIRRMKAQVEETNIQNAQLMQRLQLVEQEHETNAAQREAPAAEFVLTPTAPQQDLEVLAPVSEIYELLIIEPEELNGKPNFIVTVPSKAVGARLRAIIDHFTSTMHFGGHMVYGSTIIQDHVPLAQGYGLQDQDNVCIFPKGHLPTWTDEEVPTVQDPVFHSLPASSSSVKVLDENNQGEATPNARIVQPSFSDGGKSLNGYGKDPSGELTLPDPLEAGKAGNPPNKPTVSLFVPVSPEKATIGEVP
ncbi:MAG: hypothetical protein GY818_12085, partial [Planctomycetaceae bacterium]|nr:hypothetical protein [Planctomycetaceae bacterium]